MINYEKKLEELAAFINRMNDEGNYNTANAAEEEYSKLKREWKENK